MSRGVLFYTDTFRGGGAEVVFGRLAAAFADAGDDVVFAADHAGLHRPADRAGLRHLVLGPSHAGATLRLAALLRRETPRASFSALGAQNLKHVAAAALAGRLAHCVLGYHGFAEAEPQRLSRLSYRMTPLLTRLAARTVCVSDALLADVAAHWGGRRLQRIHNPVAGATRAASPEPGLVLAVGRLAPIKRFHDLVLAISHLQREAARLVILGEGPERSALEALAARFGVRADFPGYTDDPSPWYARAACLAITSASESFGLTAAEALAHGVPVVTTACGGPPEVLGLASGAGSCGRVVPVGDVAALAAALTATLDDPGDPAARFERARAFGLTRAHEAYAALADALA